VKAVAALYLMRVATLGNASKWMYSSSMPLIKGPLLLSNIFEYGKEKFP
jgi:hypothetical protein